MEILYDYLIVGAGLFGSIFAYRANKQGKSCLVIDKRQHIGGNLFCERIHNINVHSYGPHIFHTSDKEVWDFVNSLTEFNNFVNCPLANYRGTVYNLPFNMNTFRQLWNISLPDEARVIIRQQTDEALANIKDGIPHNLEEQALSMAGKTIYEKFIRHYTEKQWGRPCRELPASIIKRIPVRFTYDNNYFSDIYQGIPVNGYNSLIETLLYGIPVELNVDFFKHRERFKKIARNIVYTGPIDEFYNYKYGKLEYRTVRFETETLNTCNAQGVAVMNYTDNETPYTRIIEHKHFESFGDHVYDNPYTVITKEFSTEWKEGMEPYYPVNDEKNNSVYSLYREEAEKENNVIFGGRLAEYKYYDMDDIVRKALDVEIR